MKLAILIPAHNEFNNLKKLLPAIDALGLSFDLILVDDASTDKTSLIKNEVNLKNVSLEIIKKRKQEGLHAVYICGLKALQDRNYDGIITMDADLSHRPEDVLKLIENSGNDLVVGSRYISGGNTKSWNFFRRIISQTARNLSRLILRIKTKDCTSGFKYYSSSFLKSVNLNELTTSGYSFQVEMILLAEKGDFKIKEVPITFLNRKEGYSKMGVKEVFRFGKNILKLFIKSTLPF